MRGNKRMQVEYPALSGGWSFCRTRGRVVSFGYEYGFRPDNGFGPLRRPAGSTMGRLTVRALNRLREACRDIRLRWAGRRFRIGPEWIGTGDLRRRFQHRVAAAIRQSVW